MRFEGVNWLSPDTTLCGATRCGVTRCGVTRCGVTRCGAIHYGAVETADGRIKRTEVYSSAPRDGARLLLPGCVDIHTHAMMGACYAPYGAMDFAECRAARVALARGGSTSFLQATMALGEKELLAQCAAAGELCRDHSAGEARCLGVYVEGPFLSPGRRGAHAAQNLRAPSKELYDRLNEASRGAIRVVCMASELEGAGELALYAQKHSVVSLAHSQCGYEEAALAFSGGFSNLTHAFNAMEPMHHRAPGPILAAAEAPQVTAELIADGVHVHPAMVRLLFQMFGAGRVILISDSIAVCGLSDGVYDIDGQAIRLSDGRATIDGSSTIAGSAATLFEGVRRAVDFGIPLEDAISAATINPARRLNMENELGSIAPGLRADMLLCDEKLNIEAVYMDGKLI